MDIIQGKIIRGEGRGGNTVGFRYKSSLSVLPGTHRGVPGNTLEAKMYFRAEFNITHTKVLNYSSWSSIGYPYLL